MRNLTCLLLASILGLACPARAQTISLGFGTGAGGERAFDVVVGEQFAVSTTIDTGGRDTIAAEWVQTELQDLFPEVFKLGTVHIGSGDCFGCVPVPGEYLEAFGGCIPASSWLLPVLRVSYLDFGGYIGNDVILTLRGFLPGDSRPSSFNGSPGFVDCNSTKFPLEVAGGDAWQTGTGAIVPPGGVILNPTPPLVVGNEDIPVSHLKARFR